MIDSQYAYELVAPLLILLIKRDTLHILHILCNYLMEGIQIWRCDIILVDPLLCH
jgi:hypothetical protein